MQESIKVKFLNGKTYLPFTIFAIQNLFSYKQFDNFRHR